MKRFNKNGRRNAGTQGRGENSLPAPPPTLDVTIEKIVPNGFGLAFAENSTVFVPLAAAGDRLRVRVNQTKGKTAFAEIVEIVEPSKDRTAPRCPYFGRCGGCDFQHLDYAAQLRAKAAIVGDCLTRIGKITNQPPIEIIGSPREYEYRARAQWHAAARRRKIGYFQRKSHDVIDAEVCPILKPELETLLRDLRARLDWAAFSGETVEIEASSGDRAAISVYSSEIIEPTAEISFAAAGETYFYDANNFFQGNPFLIEPLIEAATKNATGAFALDLYCGVGLFTVPLARQFQRAIGVEGSNKAIDFAERNREYARLENVEFKREAVGDFLRDNAENLKNIDFLLLDPPRSGTEKETIRAIVNLRPREISYVSCEPSMLARDLKTFLENGYEIRSIVALDLFPQTHHVETVARLRLLRA